MHLAVEEIYTCKFQALADWYFQLFEQEEEEEEKEEETHRSLIGPKLTN